MRRIAIRFPLTDGNGEKFQSVGSCARVNSSLMKRPPAEQSVSDRHEGLFWLSFVAGRHPESISKSSFLSKLHTKKQHFLFPHAPVSMSGGAGASRKRWERWETKTAAGRKVCEKRLRDPTCSSTNTAGPRHSRILLPLAPGASIHVRGRARPHQIYVHQGACARV